MFRKEKFFRFHPLQILVRYFLSSQFHNFWKVEYRYKKFNIFILNYII